MKYKAKIVFSSAALILSVILLGCEGDILPPQNSVDVHLFNQRGFDYINDYGYPNLSIGNYPIILTDEFGKCHFENVSIPYDLTVSSFDGNFLFKEVKETNPAITLNGNDFNYNESCRLQVYFPGVKSGIGIVKFISEDLFGQPGSELIIDLSFGNYYLDIFIPKNKTSINGKLIYMKCTDFFKNDQNFYISSFDNLGMKNIVLYPGLNNSIIFKPEEIQTSPKVTNFSFSTVIPANSEPQTKIYLTFPGYNRNSNIAIYANYYLQDQINVPLNLTIPLQIKIESICYTNYFSSFNPTKYINCHPDTTINIVHSLINMDYPQNEQKNINDNSVFSFSDNSPKGIYAIEILQTTSYGGILFTTVFTDKNSIKWGEMKNRNFTPKPNTHYEWSVSKFSSFENIDDFLSSQLYDRENFNTISSSNNRGFTTIP